MKGVNYFKEIFKVAIKFILKALKSMVEVNMMTYKSSRLLAGLRLTKALFPDKIEVIGGQALITKKRWLGLITDDESIVIERLASVTVKRSLISAKIIIETMGGAKQDIVIERLWRGTAKKIAKALRDH